MFTQQNLVETCLDKRQLEFSPPAYKIKIRTGEIFLRGGGVLSKFSFCFINVYITPYPPKKFIKIKIILWGEVTINVAFSIVD